jgi:hypothetical protein
MNRWIVLLVVAAAAWYGWKHWTEIRQAPRDEVMIVNETGKVLVRVRVTVGGETYVRESIADGAKARFPFPVTGDGVVALKWQYDREELDMSWSGGQVAAGPLRIRHVVRMMQDGGVVWTPEHLTIVSP